MRTPPAKRPFLSNSKLRINRRRVSGLLDGRKRLLETMEKGMLAAECCLRHALPVVGPRRGRRWSGIGMVETQKLQDAPLPEVAKPSSDN